MSNKISRLVRELKRRKVINTMILYVVSGWVILQVGDVVFPLLGNEETHVYLLLSVLAVGFPAAVLISWFYQVTPKGFVRVLPFVERRHLENISPHPDRRLGSGGNASLVTSSGWFVYAESGPVEGLEYPINNAVVIGRAMECDITLSRSYVSRGHARLKLVDKRLLIEDLDSSNGTYVNGVKIVGEESLQHGDEISFKDVVFRVREDRLQFQDEAMMNQTMVVGNIEKS